MGDLAASLREYGEMSDDNQPAAAAAFRSGADEIDRLNGVIMGLRAALEPFTNRSNQRVGDDHLTDDYRIKTYPTMAAIRAARAALSVCEAGND